MKIAFIVNQFPLLSETFILNQITGLIDRGHEVDIFANIPGYTSKIHEDVKKYNLLDHTYYRYSMMPKNRILRVIKGIGFIIRYVHENPVPLFNSVNFFKYRRKAFSLGLLFQIIPFLEKGPYDIIHCHFGPNGNFGALLKEIGLIKARLLTTFYGYDFSMYIKQFGERVYDPLFERCDMVFVLSEKMKNELTRLGCSKQKVSVHRLGIDMNKFRFLPRQPGNDGKLCLLTIARLVEKKGVEYGIQAVKKAIQIYPQIEYKIVGDGPLKSVLESLINKLGVKGKIRLLGWKRQEEIVKLLRNTNILLAPSVTAKDGDQEGTPTVLIEALARGLPVLSTHHSGIPEVVEDGKSGFLAPERDVDILTEKLIYLIEHPEIWQDMGRAGRAYVEKYYDIYKLNNRLVEIYQRLLEES